MGGGTGFLHIKCLFFVFSFLISSVENPNLGLAIDEGGAIDGTAEEADLVEDYQIENREELDAQAYVFKKKALIFLSMIEPLEDYQVEPLLEELERFFSEYERLVRSRIGENRRQSDYIRDDDWLSNP